MGLQGFLEGGLASITAGFVTHPLDLIKVRMQLQGEQQNQHIPCSQPSLKLKPAFAIATPTPANYSRVHTPFHPSPSPPASGPLSLAAKIIRAEGFPALFSGASATMLRQTLYSSTRLGIYEFLSKQWSSSSLTVSTSSSPAQTSSSTSNVSSEKQGISATQRILAGLIAGGTGAAIGNPADVALIRMQADGRLPVHLRRNYTSVGHALFQIIRNEGLPSLWRGSSLTIQRAMVVTASQLATYDQTKEFLLTQRKMKDGIAVHLTASCFAGLVASAASNPLDVIKTRIMNMKKEVGCSPMYSGAFDCAIKTVKREGFMSLYKGFTPTVMRQGPYTIVLFVTLEQIRRVFGQHSSS